MLRMPARATWLVLPLVACAAPGPQRAPTDAIDALVTARMAELGLPGVSLAVVRDGQLVKSAGYGFADLELLAPATADTVYEIGSCTKAFTAVAIQQLASAGALALDEPVARAFPAAPASWQGITLRHLLTHTSGIQNHVAVPGWMDVFARHLDYRVTPAVEDMPARFFSLPLEFAPGATWAYDNTGYYLLGLVVEQRGRQPFGRYLEDHVFTPAGMASLRTTAEEALVPHRAAGYGHDGARFVNRPALSPGIAFAAGALLANARDLARLPEALAAGRLLPADAVARGWTGARGLHGERLPYDYGFGWFVGSCADHPFVQHSGGTPGCSAVMYWFLSQRLAVVVLANRGDRMLDALAIDVAGLVVPALQRTVAATDPDPARTGRHRTLVAGLLAGAPDLAACTAPMRAFLGTASGRGMWQWHREHGDLGAFTFAGEERDGDEQVVRYRAELGASPHWLSLRLDAHGAVAQAIWW